MTEFKDAVEDQTTTTGTGTVTAAGIAPAGRRTIAAAHTTAATIGYRIESADKTEWENGYGVWTASGATLTRVTVTASSNAGELVNFSAGTKKVITTLLAGDVVDLAGNMSWCGTAAGSANAITLTPDPPISAYKAGRSFRFKNQASTNTGAVTIQVSGLATPRVIQKQGVALVAGDLVGGKWYDVIDDGAGFQLVNVISTQAASYQAFTASGTWTKPTGLTGNEMVVIELWGGGGGASSAGGGGGGGGAYARLATRASALSATVSVTVGAAGATTPNAGGNSSFGSYVSAFGGGAGSTTGGGGGGGGGAKAIGANSPTDGTGGSGGLGYSERLAKTTAGDGVDGGGGGGGSASVDGGCSLLGGGGGAYNGSAGKGGNSTYGGGGGTGYNGTGGVSMFGGNGGDPGIAGTVPGGGGGNGAAGARGECRVWVLLN